jgi:hypothetical protein
MMRGITMSPIIIRTTIPAITRSLFLFILLVSFLNAYVSKFEAPNSKEIQIPKFLSLQA